ncbi:MAG: hypothetical protein LBG13_02320 [Holosporales bacterium]|nr:hypothetical protein [Holosporales bacterium]
MGQKFFLRKNKKACYYNIDTCSCGLCYPRELAGLTRRVLVCVREAMRKISRTNPEGGFWVGFFPDFCLKIQNLFVALVYTAHLLQRYLLGVRYCSLVFAFTKFINSFKNIIH